MAFPIHQIDPVHLRSTISLQTFDPFLVPLPLRPDQLAVLHLLYDSLSSSRYVRGHESSIKRLDVSSERTRSGSICDKSEESVRGQFLLRKKGMKRQRTKRVVRRSSKDRETRRTTDDSTVDVDDRDLRWEGTGTESLCGFAAKEGRNEQETSGATVPT